MDFAVPVDYRVKLKESKKRDNYLDLVRELNKLWNMKVMNISIVISALGTVSKILVQRLEDLEITAQVETVKTRVFLRFARILRKVLETQRYTLSLKIKWKSGDRDETINNIISECSKLAQKEYKARHDWTVKVIHWDMSRKFQFDHTNKWYMHNPAPVLENDSHKLVWDFNIQTDLPIPARRPDLIKIYKKQKRICKIVDFAVPADHRINLKESEKKDKYLDLARELKKLLNMKVPIVPIVIGALDTVTKGLLKGLEGLEVGGRVETKRQHC